VRVSTVLLERAKGAVDEDSEVHDGRGTCHVAFDHTGTVRRLRRTTVEESAVSVSV